MNDNAYRIFILSSAKVLICMVTAMRKDWTNCLVFSQPPSKVSGLAALAFLIGWPPVGACTLVRIVCATADAAWEAALATSSGASNIWVCRSLLALLQVSALHYLAGDRVSGGCRTVASARALLQPTSCGSEYLYNQCPQVQNL